MSLSPIVASIGADTGDVTKQSKGEKGNKQYAYKTAPIAIEKQTSEEKNQLLIRECKH